MNSQKSWISVILIFIKAFFRVSTDATNVVGDAVSMAERAVKAAKHRQLIDITIATRNYKAEAIAVAGLQRLKTHNAIQDYIGEDASKAKIFTDETKALDAAIASEFAKLEAAEASDA